MKEILQNLSEKPGCYQFKDINEKIIYVGKAKNLKKRVSSYFNKAHNFKTTQLVREINSVETIITDNEKESLLLEQNLIKKYKPKYNIVLNDDKRYPYISITNQKDPEYLYTRNYDTRHAFSFGPLPDGSSARKILRTLERIYPLRRCKGNLDKPCLYYHIEQCSGACFKEVEQIYYKKQIENVKKFFSGDSQDIKDKLTAKMHLAADNLQFEEAQRIKEILNHIDFSISNQLVDLNDNLNRDVFNYYIEQDYICLTVLFYRNGQLSLKDQELIIDNQQGIEDLLKSFMLQIYSKNMIPDYIMIPEEISKSDLKLIFGNKIIDSNSKTSIQLLELAKQNALEYLKEKLTYQKQVKIDNQELLIALKKTLNLPTYPQHIEMFDIANILDEFVTGAMVVYKNAKPSFNDFRKFNIEIEQKDDYHRMQNLVYRRYYKDLFNKTNLPDLIIADGGIIQVHAIKTQLELLNLNIPVIGLVKNDKHKTEYILDLNEERLEIQKTGQLFKFLESIQLRVHNFAISSFKSRQQKSIFNDELTQVKGLGKILIDKLNLKFPERKKLYSASKEELKDIIKNEKTLNNLLYFLKDKSNGQ